MKITAIFFSALAIFIVIDAIWLSQTLTKLYKPHIGHLLADKPNYVAAIIFYFIFVFGLVYFCIMPNLSATLVTVITAGAIYGAATYATYDLTNNATLKSWPAFISLIDICWGAFVSSTVASLVWLIFRNRAA